MRQLGGEFAKNLMTPQTAIRGLTSGVLSDLTTLSMLVQVLLLMIG